MLQIKFLLVGLLLAAGFIAYQWLGSLPSIPPVRLPASAEANEAAPLIPATSNASTQTIFGANPDDLAASADASADIVLPLLNDSDSWLRERLADTALPWLAETELIRLSATVLEHASRGEVPRKFVEFLAPTGKFTVTRKGNLLAASASNYARYDSFVAALMLLSPERAAATFDVIEPLLWDALSELGGDATGKVATPRELAYAALRIALATPSAPENPALVQPKVVYKYASKDLEALQPLQKQLLRMGPENLEKVRLWLEEFGAALRPGLGIEMTPDTPFVANEPLL